MIPVAKISLNRWMWVAAVGLMLAEFLLFDRMTSEHYASIYPRWNDQIQYLTESYRAYEQLQANGLVAALKSTLTKTALQGTLHDFFAVLVFWVSGSASRSAALSLNILVFLAWQASLLAIIPRVTGSRALGWMAFGLVLCLGWPWSGEAASAVDFRLDHGAMCLMGITSAVALMTDGFRSLRWSLVFGAAVGVTILERFITGAYFAVIFVVSAGWVLCDEARWRRLRNLVLAGLVTTVLTLPVFWVNRLAIYNYYWVGHITGAEGAVRQSGMDFVHSLGFIFARLGDMQLGTYFGWTAAGLTAALLLLFLIARRQTGEPGRNWLFFPVAFLLVPAAVLGVQPEKSAYVLGVLVPGALLLLVWVWAVLSRRIDRPAGGWRRYAPAVVALAAVVAGERYFIHRQLWRPYSDEFRSSAGKVNQLASYIFTTSRSVGLSQPTTGVDQITDYLDAQIMQVVGYERQKIWLTFSMQLPESILTIKEESIFYRLPLCDFILLTDEMPDNGRWPYDQQMHLLYPRLKEWCDGHLYLVKTFNIFDRRMSLYQRREFPTAAAAFLP